MPDDLATVRLILAMLCRECVPFVEHGRSYSRPSYRTGGRSTLPVALDETADAGAAHYRNPR